MAFERCLIKDYLLTYLLTYHLPIFQHLKMFRLQHKFNNIIETTQLNIDQMLEFHCHCKCSKCSPPTPSNNTSLQLPYFRNFLQACRSVPDNLKRFFEFGACFQLCFKLAVSLQHCTPYVIFHWVYIQGIWRPLVFSGDIWTAGPQPVLCAARFCALCVLTRPARRPSKRWIRWAAGDCSKGTII